ncbi:electron transfer flavoprotein subunit alpha/FixB family protein [Desulfobotulus sp.]|jgi:electron transfer flavoprotein alpha subunit|uniref:electron transfer flavoprotein subunit alpha/FixB family protein n=1 Tax=Desulfobotulus sp. TaxID=1940337 RepID=UPI002A35F6B0|nr:electron transfer flavoprotein subunit alpha/FixB family protein [Desulfobotulus sp.]MDY0161831.1 electron transfer flavoprotein subunit alpha/FixB family protein [Desulfobotulus sp.]
MKIWMILGSKEKLSTGAEMLAAARQIGEDRSACPTFVFPFGDGAQQAKDFAALGADVQIFAPGGKGDDLTPEGALFCLRACMAPGKEDFVLMPDAAMWRAVAPALAFHLEAAFAAGIRALRWEGEELFLGRQTWSGRRLAWLGLRGGPGVFTVAQGAFLPGERGEKSGSITSFAPLIPGGESRFCGEEPGAGVALGLKEARIIVAAGRGVGGPEGLDLLGKLATHLPGSILGGSRPVCDCGWLPYDRQIGETGADVAPELYLACGVSGASQHLVGMGRSGLVVVVNKDPAAPFFRHGDVGIVEDLGAFLPRLLEVLAEEKKK